MDGLIRADGGAEPCEPWKPKQRGNHVSGFMPLQVADMGDKRGAAEIEEITRSKTMGHGSLTRDDC